MKDLLNLVAVLALCVLAGNLAVALLTHFKL